MHDFYPPEQVTVVVDPEGVKKTPPNTDLVKGDYKYATNKLTLLPVLTVNIQTGHSPPVKPFQSSVNCCGVTGEAPLYKMFL